MADPRKLLTTAEWQARALTHMERVQQWTRPNRERRSRGEVHPVYDFLFQYYSYSGGRLERWHPDRHERLVDSPEARERFSAPTYEATDGVIQRSASALTASERGTLEQTLHLLSSTRDRSPNFGCFGMHEWAMVYGGHDIRHAGTAPLRLPQVEIDALVESRPVACSHFDAFRFFAPAAQPMNRIPLAWATRYAAEQPGCIHANMDLYRWAYTSMPWIGSDLLWGCFDLAMKLRVLDMQAGPYDLRAFGFEPVRIETAEGRDEYQQRQRELSVRASTLRTELINAVSAILA
ncbi:MAG: 3-methyladenine DNA glycosylase [Gemmatimonadaceae bacterium]|nr:3-methyladenine DNA glycosylase [Gemmatimonadaceae bacterium]